MFVHWRALFFPILVAQANSWSQLSPDGSVPSARDRHTAVWSDSADGFYIFGGYDGSVLNDLHFYSRQVSRADSVVTIVLLSAGVFVVIILGSLLAVQIRRMRRRSSMDTRVGANIFHVTWARRRNKELRLADPLAIKEFLLYADVGMLRLEFLQELQRKGSVLPPRRQEAEAMHIEDLTALVTRRELESLEYDEEIRKFFRNDDDGSRIEVHLCSVSHVWEAREHPDPWGFQLAEIIKRFEQLDGSVWIFFDSNSFFQYPRTSTQQIRSFRRALGHMHLLYAHDLVNVQVIDQMTPEETKRIREKDHNEIQVYWETMGEDGKVVGEVRFVKIQDLTFNDNPYTVRGWCQAEQQWANLREGVDDHVPMPPNLFEAIMDALKFTHRSDTAAVQMLQKKVFASKVAEAKRLTFSRLPEGEVKLLCEALPHYTKLEVINVSNTQLSAEAVEAILSSRATLTMLVHCDLDDALVRAICQVIEMQHVAVKTLDLGENTRVSEGARIDLLLATARKNIKLRFGSELGAAGSFFMPGTTSVWEVPQMLQVPHERQTFNEPAADSNRPSADGGENIGSGSAIVCL